MSRLAEGIGFVVSALAVGAVVSMGSAPSVSPAPVVVEPAPERPLARPQADCPDESPAIAGILERRQALASAEQALAVLQAQEELATGAPLEWPDDAPESHQEIAVEAGLSQIAEKTGGALIGLDCGEFPCVAVMAWPGLENGLIDTVRESIRARWPEALSGGHSLYMDDETGQLDGNVMTFALPVDALDEAPKERVDFRLDEATGVFDPRAHFDSIAE